MAQIGRFIRTRSGFTGCIDTLFLSRDLSLVPAESFDAEAPDYRVRLGEEGPAIGAGWKRTSDKAGEYVSILIDDPALAKPIYANLFRLGDDQSAWVLQWNRPNKRGQRD